MSKQTVSSLGVDDSYLKLLAVDLNVEFKKRHNRSVAANYSDRSDRNRFAANLLKGLAGKKILNLGGGGERHLESHLSADYSVHEVDIVGDCDTKLDLDSVQTLPFDSSSFDICCAFDVLEHLESFHLINKELFRITKSEVIISLPNSAFEILPNVFLNKPQKRPDLNRGAFSKFYGLPLIKPNDRHRWWLYFQDITRYFIWFESQHPCKVEFFVPDESRKERLLKWIIRDHLYYTFFCPHVWIRISKEV